MNILFLFHYYNRDFKPFKSLTELPFEEAKQILLQQKGRRKISSSEYRCFFAKALRQGSETAEDVSRTRRQSTKNSANLYDVG